MQLQMTAPLDIGLEHQDAALRMGQGDTFDLSTTERAMSKKGGAKLLTDRLNGKEEESDDDDNPNADGQDLDSDSEGEKEVDDLEITLDEMYDAYQNKLREKDSKFKVREMRAKNREREEWRGVQEKGCSSEDEYSPAEENSDEGGWNSDDLSDASSQSSESEDETLKSQKRRLAADGSSKPSKRQRLITDLREPETKDNQATKLWFSRDVFTNEEVLGVESGEEKSSIDSSPRSNAQASLVPILLR